MPQVCQLYPEDTSSSYWQACTNCCKTVGQPAGLNDKDGVNGELVIDFGLSNPLFSNLGGAGPYTSDWGQYYWYNAFVLTPDTDVPSCDCSTGVAYAQGTSHPWINELQSLNKCLLKSDEPPFGGVEGDRPFPRHNCPEKTVGTTPACCSVVNPEVITYPDQPHVMRFSNVGTMMETKIDYVLEEVTQGEYIAQFDSHRDDPIFVRRGLQFNVADAGGIVAVNVPAPGEVSVKVGIRGSCCARKTCRECQVNITDVACRYWEDGAPGCDPTCLPEDPILETVNMYCCCFGVDTFPLEYMGMCNDEITPFFSPRIDGGFRDRYLEQRQIPGFLNTTEQQCDSSHVRAVNRWVQLRKSVEAALAICNAQSTFNMLSPELQVMCQGGMLERLQPKMPPALLQYPAGAHIDNWQDRPLTEVMSLTLPGFIPWGLTLRNRLFDFDRGGAALRYLEEVYIYSEDFNILYWRYPTSYDTCNNNYQTIAEIRGSDRSSSLTDMSPNGACCKSTGGKKDAGDFGSTDPIVRYSDATNENSVANPTEDIFQSGTGTVVYPTSPPTTRRSDPNWLPDEQTHLYSSFVKLDDCCGCINTCGTNGKLPCCDRYNNPPYSLFVSGDTVDNACTRQCDVYDQYNSSMMVPFLKGFGSFYANDTLLVETPIEVPGRQPIDLRSIHNIPLLPGETLPGNWNLRFRANTYGGPENNVRSTIDADEIEGSQVSNCVEDSTFPNTSPFYNPCNYILDPITDEIFGAIRGDEIWAGRCQVAVRMIDVYYAINAATSNGVILKFKMSTCQRLTGSQQIDEFRNNCAGYPDGDDPAQNGRNVLFTSDSTSPLCVPTECVARQACRFHTDCPSNDGHPRFCARKCISGDCPKVGVESARFLGRPDIPGVSGYGVCQECFDCAYDDELYPVAGLTKGENTCARQCAVLSPAEANGFGPYGLCPGCNQLSTLMTAFVDGSIAANAYVPTPDNVNPAYMRCASSADCGAGLYCSVQCDTNVASLAPKYGMSEACNEFNGVPTSSGGWGFCQPCSTGCKSWLFIRDNYDNDGEFRPNTIDNITECPDVCGLRCPRCFMDKLCEGERIMSARRGIDYTLAERTYHLEPHSDPVDGDTDYNYFMVGFGVQVDLTSGLGYVELGDGFCDSSGPFFGQPLVYSPKMIGGTAFHRGWGEGQTARVAQERCDAEPLCTHVVWYPSNVNPFGSKNYWMYSFVNGTMAQVTRDPTMTSLNQPRCYQKPTVTLRQLGYHSPALGPTAESGCWKQSPNASVIFDEAKRTFVLPSGLNEEDVVCPCLTSHPQGITPNSNGFLDVTIGGTIYPYSADYGTGCRAHDNNYPPSCQGTNRESWCTQQWCYVDPQDCNVAKTVSSYFPGIDAYYSYVPCLV